MRGYTTMRYYHVYLTEAGVHLMFQCHADDWNHAAEQALDAYQEGKVRSIIMVS